MRQNTTRLLINWPILYALPLGTCRTDQCDDDDLRTTCPSWVIPSEPTAILAAILTCAEA